MFCKGISVGITVNPIVGKVGAMVSLHDEEGEDEVRAFIVLEPEKAMQTAMLLMARAQEAHSMEVEIQATPMDDRDAAIARCVERLNRSTN